jgi:hypothetical protein
VGIVRENMNDKTVLQGQERGAWIVMELTRLETGIVKDTVIQLPRSNGNKPSYTTTEHQEVTVRHGGLDQ